MLYFHAVILPPLRRCRCSFFAMLLMIASALPRQFFRYVTLLQMYAADISPMLAMMPPLY